MHTVGAGFVDPFGFEIKTRWLNLPLQMFVFGHINKRAIAHLYCDRSLRFMG